MRALRLTTDVVTKGTLSEEEASLILRKITSAVTHMHTSNIIHRDLKPENPLLTSKEEGEVKLIDFGLAKVMFDEEASSMFQALHHPNIIQLEDTFESPDRIYLVMEMMRGGELFDYVVTKGTLSEEEASLILRKITSAVTHMHTSNIIHRDLKPENLLLTSNEEGEVKL